MDLPVELQTILSADDGPALAALLAAGDGAGGGGQPLRSLALRAACVLGLPGCAAVAAAREEDVLLPDTHTFTSLHHAARGGHAEVLGVLLSHLQVGKVDIETDDVRLSRLSYLCGGVTPLHLAAVSGSTESVAMLLDARADVGVMDLNGWAAADHARGNAAVLELLHTQPAAAIAPAEYENATRQRCVQNTSSVEPSVFAGLLQAADEGQPAELLRLLRAGDVKNMKVASSSLLQAATSLGSPSGLRVILDALRAQGKPGHDPEAAKTLALPGLNDLGAMGLAPLHAAVETGFPECLLPLLEAGADVHLCTADGSFPLGQTATVYTEGGRTALHIAVQKGDAVAIEQLLAAGALPCEMGGCGVTPRELALEALVLPEGSGRAAARLRVAELLGVPQLEDGHGDDQEQGQGQGQGQVQEEGQAQSPSRLQPEEVRARRAQREKRLRERVAEASARERARDCLEVRRAVQEHYVPLEADLASGHLGDVRGHDLVEWGTEADRPLKRRCSVGGGLDVGVETPVPGVFVFQFLSEALCTRIWDETEHYLTQAAERNLPQPIRHDGGLDLSKVFPELMQCLADAAMPAIQALLPEQLHAVSLRHAFRTKNFVGRGEQFRRHMDKYAVTLNICIRRTADVRGSGVFFYDSLAAEAPLYRHEHALGLAVLHSSKECHQTEPLEAGERGSIIMWFDHDQH